MSRLNLFLISLSNVEGAYYAGQTVQGHCTVELVRDMCMKDLHLEFKGQAEVSFTQMEEKKHSSDSSLDEVTKSASENYLDETMVLLSDESKGSVTLPPGRHTFPFSFPLPPTAPSSFKGKHGQVTYMLKAIISRPWKTDHDTEKEVIVIGILDLNLDPSAERPCEVEEEEMVCCLCCQSGPLVAKFRIERTGHILGEEVQFCVAVNNASSCDISFCSLYLEMDSTYRADPDTRTSHTEVCRVYSEHFQVEPGKSSTWDKTQEQLVIPPDLAPTGLPGCSLMDVSYKVTLFVNPAWSTGLTISLPITIGTFPSRYATAGNPPLPCQPRYMTPLEGYPPIPPPNPDELRARMPSAPHAEDEREKASPRVSPRASPRASPRGWSSEPLAGVDEGGMAGAVEMRQIGFIEDIPLAPPPSYEKCTQQWGYKA